MFSIIIPLYNKSHYISRAIDSVLNQSFSEWELIIIDDGSKDDGSSRVLPYISEKVHLFQQENKGVSYTRNYGVSLGKNPFIAFLDADDYWHQDYLKTARNVINSNSDLGIIGTNYLSFKDIREIEEFKTSNDDTNYEILPIKKFFGTYLLNALFFTSSVIIKKDFFSKNSGFDSNLKFGEDLDVWFRAILYYGKLVYVSNQLVFYSKEDEYSATKRTYHLSETLIPKILNDHFYKIDNINGIEAQNAFLSFRIKWIYLRLFPLFLNKQNKDSLKKLLEKLPYEFMLIGIFYRLPFNIFSYFIGKNRIKYYFKKHIEHCYNTIYKS